MKYLAAYMMLVLAGNQTPSAADVTNVLKSVGVDADAERLNVLLEKLNGKNLEQLVAEGSAKLSAVPSGGARVGGGAAAGGAAAGGAAAPAAKEEEPEEEEDEDLGGGGLFGDDDDY
jgi:large subunit ribosomal protein LP2